MILERVLKLAIWEGEASCRAHGRAEGSAETMLVKLVRQPSFVGTWHETHPESSVCITQLKPLPRILPAYQSEHEEF